MNDKKIYDQEFDYEYEQKKHHIYLFIIFLLLLLVLKVLICVFLYKYNIKRAEEAQTSEEISKINPFDWKTVFPEV